MNVLVIGSGGREHAIAWKLSQSRSLKNLFIAPGNPGTAAIGTNVNLNPDNFESIITFCMSEDIGLVVVGPEQPLVNGIADSLREENIKVFGPVSAAAKIESSKSFAKKLMLENNIPTAAFTEYEITQYQEAKEYLKRSAFPVVLKADGLAAGKGVIIAEDLTAALKALDEYFLKNSFGESGKKILIEEYLTGEEASLFAVTDGTDFICLPPSQDHKRIGDGDTGKNTGGMGAYCPAHVVTPEILRKTETEIISPVLAALRNEGRKFIGCLYAGLILTKDGPKVIEFNCRFGDPETQAVLPLIEGDFLQLLYSAASEKLDKSAVKYSGGSAVCIVAASGGYPDKYQKGFEINGLEKFDNNPGIIIFHAGTDMKDHKIVTNGGRVIGVTAVVPDSDLASAKSKAYEALSHIHFKNIYFRKDIADKGINR